MGALSLGQRVSDPLWQGGGMSTLLPCSAESELVRDLVNQEADPGRTGQATETKRSRRAECGSQLDFAMPTPPAPARRRMVVRPCSRERAAWWFAQMRRAVDGGCEEAARRAA